MGEQLQYNPSEEPEKTRELSRLKEIFDELNRLNEQVKNKEFTGDKVQAQRAKLLGEKRNLLAQGVLKDEMSKVRASIQSIMEKEGSSFKNRPRIASRELFMQGALSPYITKKEFTVSLEDDRDDPGDKILLIHFPHTKLGRTLTVRCLLSEFTLSPPEYVSSLAFRNYDMQEGDSRALFDSDVNELFVRGPEVKIEENGVVHILSRRIAIPQVVYVYLPTSNIHVRKNGDKIRFSNLFTGCYYEIPRDALYNHPKATKRRENTLPVTAGEIGPPNSEALLLPLTLYREKKNQLTYNPNDYTCFLESRRIRIPEQVFKGLKQKYIASYMFDDNTIMFVNPDTLKGIPLNIQTFLEHPRDSGETVLSLFQLYNKQGGVDKFVRDINLLQDVISKEKMDSAQQKKFILRLLKEKLDEQTYNRLCNDMRDNLVPPQHITQKLFTFAKEYELLTLVFQPFESNDSSVPTTTLKITPEFRQLFKAT